MHNSSPHNELGFALIMTVFIIALASILVMNFANETLRYQRTTRNYTERIQADFVLKSCLNLARVLLELPKEEGIQEDWLGEPWALIAAAPALPISGFAGEPRLAIVDEGGKIDINSIAQGAGSVARNPFAGINQAAENSPQNSQADFWKNVLSELFLKAGFVREQYSSEKHRTLGNIAYSAQDQVAVIHDWIDNDSRAHSNASFPGEGIESSSPEEWFYGRPLQHISELALVPGMTLERTKRVAPYLRADQGNVNSRINVNTAPFEVLAALGFPESQALDIVQERLNLPITNELLQNLVTGAPQLARVTTVKSTNFAAYAVVRMPNVTRWAKATILVQGGFGRRRAIIRSIQFL